MQNLVRVDGLEFRAGRQNILPISLYIRMTVARYTHGEGVVGENFVSSGFQPFLLLLLSAHVVDVWYVHVAGYSLERNERNYS